MSGSSGSVRVLALLLLLCSLRICSSTDTQHAALRKHASQWREGTHRSFGRALRGRPENFALSGKPSQPLQWSLPTSAGFPAFNVSAGGTVDLLNVNVLDNSTGNEQLLQGRSFEELLVLPWLGELVPSAHATLQNVNVSVACSTLAAIQDTACKTLSVEQLSTLQVTPGVLLVDTWRSTRVQASNLRFTCQLSHQQQAQLQSPAQPDSSSSDAAWLPAPYMTCAVGRASDWSAVVSISQQLQLVASTVHVLLSDNVTTSVSNSSALGAQAIAGGWVDVYRHVRVAAMPDSPYITYLELGPLHGEGCWRMASRNASMVFEGLTFLALPLGPSNKFPMSVLPWAMWQVRMERCDPVPEAVQVINSVLVVQAETLDYVSYWTSEYLSMFPDRAEAARWWGEDMTCTPMQTRALMTEQVSRFEEHTWLAANASAMGVNLVNVTITSSYPKGVIVSRPGLQLTKLFENPYISLNQITWVTNGSEFVQALRNQATPNVVVLTNMTVSKDVWPEQAIELRRDLVIVGWADRSTVLNWDGAVELVTLNHMHNLKLRNLVLMNGGQGRRDSQPSWAANLTLYQWPVTYGWESSNSVQLQSVTIIVPPSEFAILQAARQTGGYVQPGPSSSSSPSSSPSSSSTPAAALSGNGSAGGVMPGRQSGLAWVETATFTATSAKVPLLVEACLLGYDVTITKVPLLFDQIPYNVVLGNPSPSPSGNPNPNQSSSNAAPESDSPPHQWKLVVAIVIPVAVGCFALSAGCLLIVLRRRKRRQGGDGGGDVKGSWRGLLLCNGGLRPCAAAAKEPVAWDDSAGKGASGLEGMPGSHASPSVGSGKSRTQGKRSRGLVSAKSEGGVIVGTGLQCPEQKGQGSPRLHFSSGGSSIVTSKHSPQRKSPQPGQQEEGLGLPHDSGYTSSSGSPNPDDLAGSTDAAGCGVVNPRSVRCMGEPSGRAVHVGRGSSGACLPAPSPPSTTSPRALPLLHGEGSAAALVHHRTSHGEGSVGVPAFAKMLTPDRSSISCSSSQATSGPRGPSDMHLLGLGHSQGSSQALAASWEAAAAAAAALVRAATPAPALLPAAAPTPAQQQQQSAGAGINSSSSYHDSFDVVPDDPEQLLIHQLDLTPSSVANALAAPDVVAQLRSIVGRMQQELGDQEVHITGVIGQGGSGVVYLGVWRELTVAVKSLTFSTLPSQPVNKRQQRAMSEAAICRTLHHPHIVNTYSYDLQVMHLSKGSPAPTSRRSTHHSLPGESFGQGMAASGSSVDLQYPDVHNIQDVVECKLYIIQEYCDGGTLRSLVDEGKLVGGIKAGRHHRPGGQQQQRSLSGPPANAAAGHVPHLGALLQLAADIAGGMAHVHSRSIVHGDLTPANVLLKLHQPTESGLIAKVADFGLSWKLASGQEHVSNARQGTGVYIAPEVLHLGIMSKAADVYSFGMVLHEMYHGTPMWRRKGAKPRMADVAAAARRRPGLDQLQWAAHCPEGLRALITACLSYDPQARPTFAHILTQLQAMRAGLTPLHAAHGEEALSLSPFTSRSVHEALPSHRAQQQQRQHTSEPDIMLSTSMHRQQQGGVSTPHMVLYPPSAPPALGPCMSAGRVFGATGVAGHHASSAHRSGGAVAVGGRSSAESAGAGMPSGRPEACSSGGGAGGRARHPAHHAIVTQPSAPQPWQMQQVQHRLASPLQRGSLQAHHHHPHLQQSPQQQSPQHSFQRTSLPASQDFPVLHHSGPTGSAWSFDPVIHSSEVLGHMEVEEGWMSAGGGSEHSQGGAGGATPASAWLPERAHTARAPHQPQNQQQQQQVSQQGRDASQQQHENSSCSSSKRQRAVGGAGRSYSRSLSASSSQHSLCDPAHPRSALPSVPGVDAMPRAHEAHASLLASAPLAAPQPALLATNTAAPAAQHVLQGQVVEVHGLGLGIRGDKSATGAMGAVQARPYATRSSQQHATPALQLASGGLAAAVAAAPQ